MARWAVRWIRAMIVLIFIAPVTTHAALAAWGLEQNVPNPFCPDSTTTLIGFSLDVDCQAIVEVHLFDSAEVVRTLVDAQMVAGSYLVVWDGKDDQGVLLPEGDYDIGLAAIFGGHYYLFPKIVATIECPLTPAREIRWGSIRLLYR